MSPGKATTPPLPPYAALHHLITAASTDTVTDNSTGRATLGIRSSVTSPASSHRSQLLASHTPSLLLHLLLLSLLTGGRVAGRRIRSG